MAYKTPEQMLDIILSENLLTDAFRASGRDGVEGWKPARKKSVPEFEAPHGAERTRRRRGVCLSLEDTKE